MIIQEEDRKHLLKVLSEKGPLTLAELLTGTSAVRDSALGQQYTSAVLVTLIAGGLIEFADGSYRLTNTLGTLCRCCGNVGATDNPDWQDLKVCLSCATQITGEHPGLKDSGHGLTKGQDVLVRMVVKGILPNLQVVLEPYDQTPAFPVLRVHRNMVCAYAPLEAKQSLNRIRARGWCVVACQDITDDRDLMAPKVMGVRWVFEHLDGTVVMGKGPTDLDAFRQVNARIDAHEREEAKCEEVV